MSVGFISTQGNTKGLNRQSTNYQNRQRYGISKGIIIIIFLAQLKSWEIRIITTIYTGCQLMSHSFKKNPALPKQSATRTLSLNLTSDVVCVVACHVFTLQCRNPMLIKMQRSLTEMFESPAIKQKQLKHLERKVMSHTICVTNEGI